MKLPRTRPRITGYVVRTKMHAYSRQQRTYVVGWFYTSTFFAEDINVRPTPRSHRSRYTPHRRGRWWNRLSLDLAHTRRTACALWASREGLRDAGVRGGDRLALEKRVSMLSAR